MPHDWWYGNGWGWGWGMAEMMFLSVLFWILVVVGVVLLVRWMGERAGPPPPPRGPPEDTPLEILKKRYARGEIDREQFERMKRDLLA